MAEDFLKQLEHLHTRMNAMLFEQQHTMEMSAYAGLDDRREDRVEYGDVQELAQLRDRADEFERDQHRDQTQQQGMEY